MKSFLLSILLFTIYGYLYSQTDSSVSKQQNFEPIHIDRLFKLHYLQTLNAIRNAYPLALETKRTLDEYDKRLAEIENKRKQKKYIKKEEDELKEDFTYALKDLYVHEGKMLIKLINRETGMTVDEILRKYKGDFKANVTHATFKAYGHDTKAKYDPNGVDWILEIVIQDIESGKLKFDKEVKKVSKSDYKVGMKEYREGVRTFRKEKRKNKKKRKSPGS